MRLRLLHLPEEHLLCLQQKHLAFQMAFRGTGRCKTVCIIRWTELVSGDPCIRRPCVRAFQCRVLTKSSLSEVHTRANWKSISQRKQNRNGRLGLVNIYKHGHFYDLYDHSLVSLLILLLLLLLLTCTTMTIITTTIITTTTTTHHNDNDNNNDSIVM